MKDVNVTQEAFNVVKKDVLKNINIKGETITEVFKSSNLDISDQLIDGINNTKTLGEQIELIIKYSDSLENFFVYSSFLGAKIRDSQINENIRNLLKSII
jgi:hypothetical protein